MNTQWQISSLCILLTAGLLAAAMASFTSGAPEGDVKGVEPRPVEDDMHEFMEYAFEPAYKRLQAAMAKEPADNGGWKAIKGESLQLAEGGNLLLIRTPQDDASIWREMSAAVRGAGGELYAAAKKKDFVASRKSYETLLLKCNAYHDKFAGGEHQLSP